MTDMKTCYIVGAGERTADLIAPAPGDLVIAADGGYTWLRDMGVEPDLIVGDFDSLGEPPTGANVLRLAKEKDETDVWAAVGLARERGYRSFRLYGCTGGRFDHTLANLQVLCALARRGEEGRLYGDTWIAAAFTNGALGFPAGMEGIVSVLAQDNTVEGVTLEGLKYPLTDAVLHNDFPLGVSNEFTGSSAKVGVKCGTLLVVWERQQV